MLHFASKNVFRYYFFSLLAAAIFYFASADYFYLFSISLINSTISFWGYLLVERVFMRKKPVISNSEKAKCLMLSSALVLMFASIYSLSVMMSFNSALFLLSIALLILLAYAASENS